MVLSKTWGGVNSRHRNGTAQIGFDIPAERQVLLLVSSLLKFELPAFMRVVELMRSDPRTARARVVFSAGPAVTVASTGWRDNHALAAVNRYVEKEFVKRYRPRIRADSCLILRLTVFGNSRDSWLALCLLAGVTYAWNW